MVIVNWFLILMNKWRDLEVGERDGDSRSKHSEAINCVLMLFTLFDWEHKR